MFAPKPYLNDGHQGHVVIGFKVCFNHQVHVTSSQQAVGIAVTAVEGDAHTVTHTVEGLQPSRLLDTKAVGRGKGGE